MVINRQRAENWHGIVTVFASAIDRSPLKGWQGIAYRFHITIDRCRPQGWHDIAPVIDSTLHCSWLKGWHGALFVFHIFVRT